MPVAPRTRYAKSGDVNIAYQVVGDGPFDLVYAPGFISHLEAAWELPFFVGLLGRLASFSRLILFDKRGTGLSDRGTEWPTFEERMDDIRAVMTPWGASGLRSSASPRADPCACSSPPRTPIASRR